MDRKKSFIKTKNFITVTDSLAAHGPLSRKSLAENSELSLSTVSKVIGILLDIGVIREKIESPAASLSLFDDSKICVIDLTGNDLYMYLYTLGGKCSFTTCMKRDDRYFPEERLSLFLRECAAYLKRSRIDCVGVHIITSATCSDGILVGFSHSRLASLCKSYFSGYDISIGSMEDCIIEYVRTMSPRTASLTVTEKNGKLMASVVTPDFSTGFSYVRDAYNGVILLSASDERCASRIAFALGNTITLMNVQRVIFDTCVISRDGRFCDDFSHSLETYVASDYPKDLELLIASTPLAISGAVCTARRKYIINKLYKSERDGII